jgi:hypothetical protein
MRSVAILHLGRDSEMALIFMSLIAAMRTQAVTQALDMGIGMTRG